MALFNFSSIERKGMRYKLLIAFSLMSIIPLLIMAYFVTNYIFPKISDEMLQISAIVAFALWVAAMGYILARQIIIPVLNLALETRIIADGQFDSKITMGKREDELGDIAKAVNTMTGKIRGYISELQDYSKQTAALNVKIHRKVLTLTNLMRLGDLIGSGAPFSEVLEFAAERIAGEMYGGFSIIFIKEKTGNFALQVMQNNSGRDIPATGIQAEFAGLDKLFSKNEYLIVDLKTNNSSWHKNLKEKFPGMNMVIFPIRDNAGVLGVVVLGNFGNKVEFVDDDIDVLRAFEKELILGYQSSGYGGRVSSTEIVDTITGFYTMTYLKDMLRDELNRSIYYQRPCSVLMVDIDNFRGYCDHFGADAGDKLLKAISKILDENTPPIGKVARGEFDEFGVLLPEINKREAIEVADSIRQKIEEEHFGDNISDKITVSIGVGENPIDGSKSEEVLSKAKENLFKAKTEGKNKVKGF